MASTQSDNDHLRRPSMPFSLGSAPGKIMGANGHAKDYKKEHFVNGIQVVDSDGTFGETVAPYLAYEKVIPAGFNYHLISVFGSQSTGKSTLLNNLFGTNFGVMNEEERQQTTKGIWLAKNKKAGSGESSMADNILVMDVEGTDGQERGEDQDFERKSALFALATSEILLVNMWETQVGLYHGANMGLLKTVFEVNLQLFIKDNKSIPRSLLLFVIRDYSGRTPLDNLRKTLIKNLTNIWSSISKPSGLEDSRIEDYFDFAFSALPHKLILPEKFDEEVAKLGSRFKEGYKDPKKVGLVDADSQPLLLPQYHRRIPADGFALYAKGIWEQIMSNKDLDLPTQQELLAQFRCGEIARECMILFDEAVVPLETEQADAVRNGQPTLLPDLGQLISAARSKLLQDFETAASRYHKGVYQRQSVELQSTIDARLKILFDRQLSAASTKGVAAFVEAVTSSVQAGAQSGSQYDFAGIVDKERNNAILSFEKIAQNSAVEGTSWSSYKSQLEAFKKDLVKESKRLRQEEMRLLATRVERWIKSRLDETISLEFNKLGSGRGGSRAPESGTLPPSESDHWDRVWEAFKDIVGQAEKRFLDRARSYDASEQEVEVGLWRLRRQAWSALKAKINEEVTEGNLGMKLRENFEDRFRYDEHGVPKIWQAHHDIEGQYNRALEHTLTLIPMLSKFRLSKTSSPPPLQAWIGDKPASSTRADTDDLAPIGGIDDFEHTLEDETLILTEARQADTTVRFRKMAEGVFLESKRGALGGVTATPWWMWGLLLVLGQNEIFAVARNPFLVLLLAFAGAAAYIIYMTNLAGPVIQMSTAFWEQGFAIAKDKLREFLANTEAGREAIAMSGRDGNATRTAHVSSPSASKPAPTRNAHKAEDIPLENLKGDGKKSRQSMPGVSDVWDD